jgi:sulfate adenylyltransferase subunit 1 (EFTu-like GTPase family)
MEEEGGEITLEAKEEVLLEVDIVAVLETLVEEVRTQILVNQVVKELATQRFSAITVKSMDNMHMSAGRYNITRTGKVKISLTVQTISLVLCLWRTLKHCL